MGPRLAIIGNAGSGKTTLAKRLERTLGLRRTALDDHVWHPVRRRLMRDPSRVRAELVELARAREAWVMEGVYATHLAVIVEHATHLLWLDPDPALCAARVRTRGLPEEGFGSAEQRDQRLDYVHAWAASYATRDDRDSRGGHGRLYRAFPRLKMRLTGPPPDLTSWLDGADESPEQR